MDSKKGYTIGNYLKELYHPPVSIWISPESTIIARLTTFSTRIVAKRLYIPYFWLGRGVLKLKDLKPFTVHCTYSNTIRPVMTSEDQLAIDPALVEAHQMPLENAPYPLPLHYPENLGYDARKKMWKSTESYLLGQKAIKDCLRCTHIGTECIFGPTRACVSCQKDGKECRQGTRALVWPAVTLPADFVAMKPIKSKPRKAFETPRTPQQSAPRSLAPSDISDLERRIEALETDGSLLKRIERLEEYVKTLMFKV